MLVLDLGTTTALFRAVKAKKKILYNKLLLSLHTFN